MTCTHTNCHHTPEEIDEKRRRFLQSAAGAAAISAAVAGAAVAGPDTAAAATAEAVTKYADPEKPGLPKVHFDVTLENTALVIIDPQIDFLSEKGATWSVVGNSVTEQDTVKNIEKLFIAAKAANMPVFISPHYYYPYDHKWHHEGVLEKVMHNIHMFDRADPLNVDGFEGSGADWMPQYKRYIEDGKTVVCSPHKIYGPEQNDLSLQLRKRHPIGARAFKAVGNSVTEQDTVKNIEKLFIAAKAANMPVFISPHYYYPYDHKWHHEGVLEKVMHNIHMFDRADPLNVDGFEGSGADWMPQYKRYIEDGKTVVCSPHKIYGPEQNDLNLQLRKRRIDKVILAGMSANLCVQAHLYELLEQGYEIAVVRDATAGAQVPEGDGYLAALINFRFVANDVLWTDEAVAKIRAVS